MTDQTQDLPTGFGAFLLFVLSPLTLVGLLLLVRDGAQVDAKLVVALLVSVAVNVYVAARLVARWWRRRGGART